MNRMTVYIFEMLFVLFAGALLYSRKVSKKTFLILSFFTMALILGLRGETVGEDTAHYIDVFEKTKYISWKTIFTSGTDIVYDTIWNVDRSMEVGYVLLNKIVRIFTSNAQWILVIVAFTTCYLMAKFVYDNCDRVFLPTYIIFCESLYMQSFNLARQTLAIAIGLQAYTLLKKECRHSNIKAILAIFIAFLFHKSAIVLLLLVPLWKIKDNRRGIKYIIIGSILMPFLTTAIGRFIFVIIPRYAGYFQNNYWDANVGGVAFLWLIELFMIIYIFKRYQNDDGKEVFIATACTAIYISLELVGLKFTAFTRITLYFRAFLVFLFPFFQRYLESKSRLVYKSGLILLLSLFFLRYASTLARLYYFFWQ